MLNKKMVINSKTLPALKEAIIKKQKGPLIKQQAF
jgi:hypothetical protein